MTKENNLFNEFETVSSKQWKQQIQFDLKGADYNEKLVWESLEGIKVKPFYHNDEAVPTLPIETKASEFKILQNIFVFDVEKSNAKAFDALNRGAESIRFTIENENVTIENLFKNLPLDNVSYYFNLKFLSIDFVIKLQDFASKNKANFIIQLDPIEQLAMDGNWFTNLEQDFNTLNQIASKTTDSFLTIKAGIYQNAGANMVQQLAYTLAHANEYFNRVENLNQPITIEVAVGTNYFFEIAKLRALRILFNTLAKEYNHNLECKIIATPTKRNKTIYDYNVNMLRTTPESM